MIAKASPLERIGHFLGKAFSPGFGILLLVVTYVPMILVIVFSFNQSIIAAFPLENFLSFGIAGCWRTNRFWWPSATPY